MNKYTTLFAINIAMFLITTQEWPLFPWKMMIAIVLMVVINRIKDNTSLMLVLSLTTTVAALSTVMANYSFIVNVLAVSYGIVVTTACKFWTK